MGLMGTLEQRKLHREMIEYMRALSLEVTEDYSMLYYPDSDMAKSSQRYAGILLELIKSTEETNNAKAFMQIKAIIEAYGKRQQIRNVRTSTQSKICLRLPKHIQEKLDSMYKRHLECQRHKSCLFSKTDSISR
ncbi:MAG: hypothetical protein IJ318_04055 [Clostridia bacterium]|nr:hypothetical protein [Clostridia bacterium]